jgi:ubiquinone/menaquinone biosynthesis C-methylase UbiE
MHKKPFKMFFRVLRLYFSSRNQTEKWVSQSYDRISHGYDNTWTNHMRDLTSALIDKMQVQPSAKAIDLTCGTGFATGLIARRVCSSAAHATSQKVIGIDASEGMLAQARQNHPNCEFVQADILAYLKTLPTESIDIITCCWGFGYSKPLQVLRQIHRVLKKDGQFGIIDNSLFSLREVMYCSTLAFMEQPDKLQNLMKFRFLTGPKQLWLWLKLAGLKPQIVWGGSKSYYVESGAKAIEKLRATGAAAGFEYAAKAEDSDAIFSRFAQILEQKYKVNGRIEIIHRYLGGIAAK